MSYLTEINNKLPIKGNLKKGYIFIHSNYTSYYNSFKKLKEIAYKADSENRLHVEIYKQHLYIIDLKAQEGAKQFYGLHLQNRLDLQKQIKKLMENTKNVLEKAVKLKEIT